MNSIEALIPFRILLVTMMLLALCAPPYAGEFSGSASSSSGDSPAAVTPALADAAEAYSLSADRVLLKAALKRMQSRHGSDFLKEPSAAPVLMKLVAKALACRHDDVVNDLLAMGMSAEVKDGRGNTALHLAAGKGRAGIISALLDRGADINRENAEGASPLHLAVKCGNEEAAALLIDRGADVNAKNNLGRTPLHLAADRDDKELILLLLSRGALTYEMDNKGNLPLEHKTPVSSDALPFRIREGKALPVRSLCYSRGGRFLVSGGEDGIIRMWSTSSGKLLADMSRHRGAVTSVAFSSSGSYLASASSDGTVILWDWSAERITGQELRHSSPVKSLCFSNDGRYILSGCADGTVKVWSLRSRELIRSSAVHHKSVNSLSLHGRNILSGSADGSVKMLKLPDLTVSSLCASHTSGVCSISFSAQGRQAVSGDEGGGIMVEDISSRKKLACVKAHEGAVTAVKYSPGGRYLLSSGRDGTIKVWDPHRPGRPAVLFRGSTGACCMEFSPGGRYVASGFEDGSIALIDSVTGTLLATEVGFSDREWISMTPGFYFDSSLLGARNILLPLQGGHATLDQYWNMRKNSKAVKDMLAGNMQSLKAPVLPAPPGLRILSPSDGSSTEDGKITLTLEARGERKIKDFIVLLNGRPARKAAARGNPVSGSRDGVRTISMDLAVQPGFNTIEAAAVSEDEVRSSTCMVNIHYLYPWVAPSRKLFLLTVGVSDYGDRTLNLDYAALDAQAVEKYFARMKGLLFEDVKTITLTDSGAHDHHVIRAIEDMGSQSSDNDLVIIFLAGHGVRNEKDQFFFLCHGGKKSDLPAHALGWKQFQEALMSLRAKNILLLMDACHSGSILRAEKELVTHENLAEGMTGVIVFAACRGNEASCELPGLGGVFTQSLLSGLQGKAWSEGEKEGRITLFQAERYVTGLVPRITDNRQHPVILCRERAVDIPLSIFELTK